MFLPERKSTSMKRKIISLPDCPRLESTAFWDKCSHRKGTLLCLSLLLFAGVLAGSFLFLIPDGLRERNLFPLFFSGVPQPAAGFLSCFSTLLLHSLIFLTVIFLSGFTAFGCFLTPCLLLCKGAAMGIAVSSALWADGLYGLGKSALIYLPGAAVSSILLLLFGVRAVQFSDDFRKSATLDFRSYWKDYIAFLCISVVSSFLCGGLAMLGVVFFA